MKAHSKTGLEWLYADTGKLNLKSHIQVRRLMYLWHLLSRDESELISRVYKAQKNSRNIGDLVNILEADKQELGITMSDEEIQGVPKNTFKLFVKSKVEISHILYINNLKKTHSESKHLNCTQLKMAEYLKNIAFPRGGAHLPIAHALRLLSAQELQFGG